jgi:hypothetical protein
VQQWLTGKRGIPEIAQIWPKGPVVPIRIIAPAETRANEKLEMTVIASNRKVGHNFPTGSLAISIEPTLLPQEISSCRKK